MGTYYNIIIVLYRVHLAATTVEPEPMCTHMYVYRGVPYVAQPLYSLNAHVSILINR
jgi:hypothetical protein